MLIQFFLLLTSLISLSSCAITPKKSKPMVIELPSSNAITESELEPIRAKIGNKRIVMLGESIHMTSEFSKARDILIRNLHNRGSYNLLFFEGSPIEFWIAQDEYLKSKQGETATANFQKTALFGLWQTPEIRSALSYGLASQHKNGDSGLYIEFVRS